MKKKVSAITTAALMAASLAACGGNAKEMTAADTVTAVTAEEKAEDITAAESKDETSAEAVGTGVAEETAGGGLIMVADTEFPPYEYHDGDAVVDIDAEIAKAIADELGMELEIEDIAFDSIIPETVSGKVDMDLASMIVTEDHIQSADFSNTYTKTSQRIIATKDNEIASPDNLEGIIVSVQLGATGDIYISDLGTDGTTVEHYNKGFEVVQVLSQGKIDMIIIDGESVETFVAKTQRLKILDESFTDEEHAITVRAISYTYFRAHET